MNGDSTADFFLYRCCGCGAMQAKDRQGGNLLECCSDQAQAGVEVLPVVEFKDGAWVGWISMSSLAGGLK